MSVENIVKDLTNTSKTMPKEFSIATDASNVKNRKTFPVCLQHFPVETDINVSYFVLLGVEKFLGLGLISTIWMGSQPKLFSAASASCRIYAAFLRQPSKKLKWTISRFMKFFSVMLR
jgi:hypothetical protein